MNREIDRRLKRLEEAENPQACFVVSAAPYGPDGSAPDDMAEVCSKLLTEAEWVARFCDADTRH